MADDEPVTLDEAFDNQVIRDFNPFTKTVTDLIFDKKIITEAKEQDVTQLIKKNKELQNLDDGYSPSRNMRRVASIPDILYWNLKLKGIIDDPKAFKKWLNDPDNRAFRTAEGWI